MTTLKDYGFWLLFRLPAGHLQSLPKQWLEDTVSEVSSSNGNLCATRRSAGVPYMIQVSVYFICYKFISYWVSFYRVIHFLMKLYCMILFAMLQVLK